jgi:hypothetical protein
MTEVRLDPNHIDILNQISQNDPSTMTFIQEVIGLGHSVQTKLPAAVKCHHVPCELGAGKRPFDKTRYESMQEMTTQFLDATKSSVPISTIKIDGSCGLVIKFPNDIVIVFHRRDIHIKAKSANPDMNTLHDKNKAQVKQLLEQYSGAFPTKSNSDGDIDFVWIPVSPVSNDPTQQFWRSTIVFEDDEDSIRHTIGINMATPDTNIVSIDDIQSGTYEIIGPKIQSNKYQIITVPSQYHQFRKKKMQTGFISQHYLTKHGSFVIDLTSDQIIDYHFLKQFIINHQIEGIVFHFPNGSMFKVNRGHLDDSLSSHQTFQMVVNS